MVGGFTTASVGPRSVAELPNLFMIIMPSIAKAVISQSMHDEMTVKSSGFSGVGRGEHKRAGTGWFTIFSQKKNDKLIIHKLLRLSLLR